MSVCLLVTAKDISITNRREHVHDGCVTSRKTSIILSQQYNVLRATADSAQRCLVCAWLFRGCAGNLPSGVCSSKRAVLCLCQVKVCVFWTSSGIGIRSAKETHHRKLRTSLVGSRLKIKQNDTLLLRCLFFISWPLHCHCIVFHVVLRPAACGEQRTRQRCD